jgi:transcriptional regulator with XRE-family HTH domain
VDRDKCTMASGAVELASAIGHRVRLERQARRWTLDQLAEAAGVSRRMVVNVEQGSANPSVSILLRLSDALGIGLPALVEPPQPKAVKVIRAGEGAVLWTSTAGGRGVLVAGTDPPDRPARRCATRWIICRTWRRGEMRIVPSAQSRSGPGTAWRHCCAARQAQGCRE